MRLFIYKVTHLDEGITVPMLHYVDVATNLVYRISNVGNVHDKFDRTYSGFKEEETRFVEDL